MEFSDLVESLCTVIAVPVTPFSRGGELDIIAFRRLVCDLVAGGITAITPNGNTGEFYSLSPNECRKTLEVTIEAAGGRALVVAGVGFDSATAIEMARFSRQAGAGAIMVHQICHPYRTPQGWVSYHQAIAEAVPELGIVPYVRDNMVNAAMMQHLLGLCPNIVGVKYAVPDSLLFATMVREVGVERLAWVCGVAESWAPFFWLGGARGFTSGLVNVHATLSLDMLKFLRASDYVGAMRIWSRLKPFEDLRSRHNNCNNVSVIKEAMAQLGLIGRSVRPPISELPECERVEVADILTGWELRVPPSA